jgi:hypothetical protein
LAGMLFLRCSATVSLSCLAPVAECWCRCTWLVWNARAGAFVLLWVWLPSSGASELGLVPLVGMVVLLLLLQGCLILLLLVIFS